jgi:uncharacterized protein (TIGR03067 family)
MRTQFALALIAALLVAADEPKSGADKDEKAILGTWIVTKAEREGQPDDRAVGSITLTFEKESKVKYQRQSEDAKTGTYKLDTTKSPRQLTITPGDGNRGTTGIYKVDGDELTICMPRAEAELPTEFATKAGSKTMLIVLKREQP